MTGAGRGLGLAYARALGAAGAAVVVNDVDEASAAEAVAAVEAAGGRAVAEPGAVGPSDVADALVKRAVAAFGRLDALVTNAGVLRDRILWKLTDDQFDEVVAVHLRGTFTCVRAAVRQLRAQGDGGRIITVGSPAGQRGNPGQTGYAAAKAAIVGMMRTWALECARDRITVNAVVPVAATAMTATIPAFAPHVTAWRERGVPLPDHLRAGAGFGTAEDAAGLVVFLASAASGEITGQAIGIGGDRLTLWTHPAETVAAYRTGGWDADGIAGVWQPMFAPAAQPVGIPLPAEPPA
ncbi:SDR family NAD(P)-dependent oxidoreductase [Catenuloplanes atrovinosus]|uniref:NAD(P)-dependent dehydrogenase (Short-subunit alcohol dehydrogenase family) n=1 Tax=Catenuloplanes atrovinosus TaxID=137266 RepID=A0AAE4C956_9ACTN|nr:NAD(P)-dependent dehydrogenase (short-subunit alcohol dehydrogenase family) [Catenuloplanes atrovinosus]